VRRARRTLRRRRASADHSLQRWADELADAGHLDESLQQTVCACVSRLLRTSSGTTHGCLDGCLD
jgi:hypothetical protein